MLLNDHINLMSRHPLIGPNDPIGPRFLNLVDAYDPALRKVLLDVNEEKLKLNVKEGVYLAVSGPTFETPAEIRAFSMLGADVVGMSMVPDVICARHCGLRVCSLTIVVNLAAGMTGRPLTHDETIEFSKKGSNDMKDLLLAFLGANDKW